GDHAGDALLGCTPRPVFLRPAADPVLGVGLDRAVGPGPPGRRTEPDPGALDARRPGGPARGSGRVLRLRTLADPAVAPGDAGGGWARDLRRPHRAGDRAWTVDGDP